MTYGLDFRQRVTDYAKTHSKQETCQVFNISPNTLYEWEKQLSIEGHLNPKKRTPRARKLPLDKLEAYILAHPDAFLREIAEHFDCAIPSVWASLKKLNITYKKNDNL